MKSAKREREPQVAFSLELKEVQAINHDTSVFVFCHPRDQPLPAPPTSPIWHVAACALIDGRDLEREYTPLSNWAEWRDRYSLQLLIKVYPNGPMTQYISKLQLGDTLRITEPRVTLTAPSFAPPELDTAVPDHLVLIAAGTGIMPMLQVLS